MVEEVTKQTLLHVTVVLGNRIYGTILVAGGFNYHKNSFGSTIYCMIYMRSSEIINTQNSQIYSIACKTNITKHRLHINIVCTRFFHDNFPLYIGQ